MHDEKYNIDTYLSYKDVVAITGKNRITIWRWCRDGLFPPPKKTSPFSVGFKRSEVEAWVADPAAWRAERQK